MPKVLLNVGIAMVLAGVLTLLYYLYCTQYSGEQLGKFPASGRGGTWTLSDGSSQSFPGGRATRPFSVDLDPEMNTIGFNWRGTVSGMVIGREYHQYRAWLFLAGRPVMQETFSVSRDKKDSGTSWNWVAISQFSVLQPGRYDLVLEDAREPRFSVNNMEIEIRRNVVVPSTPILVCGAVLFVAGFPLAFVVLFRGKRMSGFAVVVGTTMKTTEPVQSGLEGQVYTNKAMFAHTPYNSAATVQVLDASTKSVMAEVMSNADGTFKIALAPGTYYLAVKGSLSQTPAGPFEASSGKFSSAEAFYETLSQ